MTSVQPSPPQTIFIYGLIDPRTGDLRYIGKTHDPRHRLLEHMCPNRLKHASHVARWLSGVRAAGLRPSMIILEETSHDAWQEAEKRHIRESRARGCPLTNIREGGDGPRVITRHGRQSAERRARIGAANKGRLKTPETRARLSAALRGQPFTAEHREAIRRASTGKAASVEKRAKISASLKGRPLAMNRRGENHGAAKFTEDQVRAIRARYAGGNVTFTALAAQYGVHLQSVANVVHRKTWAHVTETCQS